MINNKTSSHMQQEHTHGISRRDILLGIGAVATAAYGGAAISAMPGHEHSKHAAQLPDLLNAATNA